MSSGTRQTKNAEISSLRCRVKTMLRFAILTKKGWKLVEQLGKWEGGGRDEERGLRADTDCDSQFTI